MEDLENEIWRDIVGFEGLYEVSSIGRVRSLERVVITKAGVKKIRSARLMSNTHLDKKGYAKISLQKYGEKRFTSSIHRLVAIAFIPNPDNLPQVNHLNCIKNDNHIENLEWTTNEGNQSHAVKNGLTRRGVDKLDCKLTENDVKIIRLMHKEKTFNRRQMSKLYNVSYPTIFHICNGNKWKHLL